MCHLFKFELFLNRTISLYYLSLILIVINSNNGLAQTDTTFVDSTRISIAIRPDSTSKINDIFIPYRSIDYGAEFYTIDSKNSFIEHHVVYQPYLNKNQTISIEIGLVDSNLETDHFFSPSDLSVNYQKIYKPKNKQESGYQGVGYALKFIIPTGRDEYFSGFDSWTLEPQVGTQWVLSNSNWLVATTVRYNFSFASLPNKIRRFSHLRFQGFIGFENKVWWGFIEPDYRYIPSLESNNIFVGINFGYKLSPHIAIRFFGKPRITGEDFFKSLYTIGGTLYL